MSDPVIAQILETLNRIEKKHDENHALLLQQNADTRDALSDHMAEEAEVQQGLRDEIHSHREESERRHKAVIESFVSFGETLEKKTDELTRAFLKKDDGTLDVEGHYSDHASRKKFNDKVEKYRDDAVGHVVKTSTLAFFLWMLYAVWEAFLKGPKQ